MRGGGINPFSYQLVLLGDEGDPRLPPGFMVLLPHASRLRPCCGDAITGPPNLHTASGRRTGDHAHNNRREERQTTPGFHAPFVVKWRGLPHGDQIILIASNFGRSVNPAWYANLKANPDVIVTYQGQSAPYVASEAQGKQRDVFWRIAVECYRGYEAYRKRAGTRRIPVILLTPTAK